MCHDHHQHSELFQYINWVHDEKYYPCPRWSALSSTTLLPSHQHKLVHVWCYTFSSLLPSIVLLYLGVLPSFISRMSCLAHPAGGPMVLDSFSARLSILPWGNCKTYSISCSWWILFVSKFWSSPVDLVNAISKHVYGTPIFNRNIWSPMLNVSCSIIQTPLYG